LLTAADPCRIEVRALDGGLTHTLEPPQIHARRIALDPGGSRLLVEGSDGFAIVESDTGAIACSVDSGVGPAWAPGGESIAFRTEDALFLFSMSAGQSELVARFERPDDVRAQPADRRPPSFSPDGRWLASNVGSYVHSVDTRPSLYPPLVALDLEEQTAVVLHAWAMDLSWSTHPKPFFELP
jgi:Tol biopolymer transport system component